MISQADASPPGLVHSLNAQKGFSTIPLRLDSLLLKDGTSIDLQQLVHIAQNAGDKIMGIYSGDFKIEYKGDSSPLTTADTASNTIICQKLGSTYPNIKIISEESTQLPYSERADETYIWSVDPLDGTKEFIKKTGEFTVNILNFFFVASTGLQTLSFILFLLI